MGEDANEVPLQHWRTVVTGCTIKDMVGRGRTIIVDTVSRSHIATEHVHWIDVAFIVSSRLGHRPLPSNVPAVGVRRDEVNDRVQGSAFLLTRVERTSTLDFKYL